MSFFGSGGKGRDEGRLFTVGLCRIFETHSCKEPLSVNYRPCESNVKYGFNDQLMMMKTASTSVVKVK